MALSDEIHDKLTNDDSSTSGTDEACGPEHDVPRSFVLILISSFLTKLGDAIEAEKSDWILGFEDRSLGRPARSGWACARCW